MFRWRSTICCPHYHDYCQPQGCCKEVIISGCRVAAQSNPSRTQYKSPDYLALYKTLLRQTTYLERNSVNSTIVKSVSEFSFELAGGSNRIIHTEAFLKLRAKAAAKLLECKTAIQQHVIDGIKFDIAAIKSAMTVHIAESICTICSLEVAQKHVTKKEAPLLAYCAARAFRETKWIDSTALSTKLTELLPDMTDSNDDNPLSQDYSLLYAGRAGVIDIHITISSLFIDPITLHSEQTKDVKCIGAGCASDDL